MASDKRYGSQAGWVVEVVVPQPEGAAPMFSYFNVAITDAKKAVAATRRADGVPSDARVEAVRTLSEQEIIALKLKSGALKEA